MTLENMLCPRKMMAKCGQKCGQKSTKKAPRGYPPGAVSSYYDSKAFHDAGPKLPSGSTPMAC